MQLLLDYWGWILFFGIVIFISIYKKTRKDNALITSKYVIQKNIDSDVNIHHKILHALEVSKFHQVYFNEQENKFCANAAFTMNSWGEHIILNYHTENSKTIINFMSICSFPFQIYDWGKNKKNFEKFWKNFNYYNQLESNKM